MVSATDVITYVGVPLAVLGVLPILYTFATALYTKVKLKRVLRKNNIEGQIRSRLMTGVVEVDLPTFRLSPLLLDDPNYWATSKPTPLSGGSWSCFLWSQWKTGQVTYRMQRSDKLSLPEATIDFESLITYIWQRGATPCIDGFHHLRQRGRQSVVGTTVMEIALRAGSTRDLLSKCAILSIAKPSGKPGLISLSLKWSESMAFLEQDSIPPSYLRGTLKRQQAESVTEDRDLHTISRHPSPDVATFRSPNIMIPELESFLEICTNGVNLSSIRKKTYLVRKHELDCKFVPSAVSMSFEPLNSWFTWAILAAYGFGKRKYLRYRPDDMVVDLAETFDITVSKAVLLGLLSSRREEDSYVIRDWTKLNRDMNSTKKRDLKLAPAKGIIESHDKTFINLLGIDKFTSKLDALIPICMRMPLHSDLRQELRGYAEKHIRLLELLPLCLRFLDCNAFSSTTYALVVRHRLSQKWKSTKKVPLNSSSMQC